MTREITARERGKMDARRIVFRRMYAHFDYLPAACREAQRANHEWDVKDMIRCAAAHCNHREEPSHAV